MDLLRSAIRYWHTLRYLRPIQFYGRIWFRYWRPRPDLSVAPDLSVLTATFQVPAKRKSSMAGPSSFLFLNESGALDEVGWNGPQREILWRYNQHYFDDLNAFDALARHSWHLPLIQDWIAQNPPGVGIGWEPYPLSLRVINWIKWALSGEKLSQEILNSLATQVRWLTGRLEIHLLGNHLFVNAKALIVAGLFFSGKEADAWLEKGLNILKREVHEQLLSDGGHFERSTMYHALALEDILDLINVTNCYHYRLGAAQKLQVAEWPQLARSMHAWLTTMCHPDGEISLFNDAAFDIAPSVAELDAYMQHLLPDIKITPEKPFHYLRDSGYVRLSHGDFLALLDVAPVGPDYLPGHAHADTLSFELSIGRQRVLVNSGTSCYGNSAERLRQRGTAAHNTVIINGLDSSEVWGGFRVARRAYPMEPYANQVKGKDSIEFSCAHNGYSRLPGRPVHRRIWRMDEEGLTVEDLISGKHSNAESRFHFHPALQINIDRSDKCGVVLLPNGQEVEWCVDYGQAYIEQSTWHPRFGISVVNTCLVVKLTNGKSKFRIGRRESLDNQVASRSMLSRE
jgi:uncharacterized heparinase superfamily protein